jgi:hypothetical protein
MSLDDATPVLSEIEEDEVIDRRTREYGNRVLPGIVYRLDGEDGYYYYGSTRGTLEERFLWHRNSSHLSSLSIEACKHFQPLG